MVVYPTGTAMRIYNAWSHHNSLASKALERVSSGKRINRAADDPAGVGISERMRAQLTMLARQQEIAADVLGASEVEDGILSSMQDMMRRMQDLATQAASGTMNDFDRELLDKEYQSLMEGIHGMDKSTTHPSFDLFQKTPPSNTGPPSATGPPGATGPSPAPPIRGAVYTNVNLTDYLDALDKHMLGLGSMEADTVRDNVMDFTRKYLEQNAAKLAPGEEGSLDSSSQGLAAQGRYTFILSANNVSLQRSNQQAPDPYGLAGTSIKTQESATEAMNALKEAQNTLLTRRGEQGALQSRLGHTMNSLQRMEEGLTDAYSRITDADIAKEYSTFVREQVLAQAASMMMSHLNNNAYQVLQLLQ